MKTWTDLTSAPQIVEIIDEDIDRDVFGDHVSPRWTPTVSDRPRWIGPAVAVALLAVGGYGAVSSLSVPDAASPPVPGVIRPQFYAADPLPTGFSIYLAEARGESFSDQADFAEPRAAELWATPDATATTGSWFVVSQGRQESTGRNSYRTVVDDTEVTFEHDPVSGQTRLSFTKNGQDMAITAFGWIDRQLIPLVRSVNIDDSTIRFSDGFFTGDHKRILRADPAAALFGRPVARVGYTTGLPTALAESFTVTVAGDDVVDKPDVERFALTDIRTFTVGDLPAIVARSAADPTVSIAQWTDGDRLITVKGNIDIDRMLEVAGAVHETTSSAVHWQVTAGSPRVAPALQVEPKQVVSGMLSDGWGWDIRVSQRNPGNAKEGYLWWIAQPGDSSKPSETRPSAPGDAPTIDTFVEDGRAYILARIPRSMHGAELHVAPNGLPSIVTRFHDVDPALAGEFAASVILEPVPFTARILDSSGNTVAFWPLL